MVKLEVQEKNGKIYCPLKEKELIATPEEKVRQRYITTLVNADKNKTEETDYKRP